MDEKKIEFIKAKYIGQDQRFQKAQEEVEPVKYSKVKPTLVQEIRSKIISINSPDNKQKMTEGLKNFTFGNISTKGANFSAFDYPVSFGKKGKGKSFDPFDF